MAETLTLYKLIILKMLELSDSPLSNSRISDFILEKGYTNYFSLQQALSEMAQTGHVTSLTKANSTLYKITENGKNTLDYLGSKLTGAICKDIQDYIKENKLEIQNELSTTADYYPGSGSDYLVRCQVREQESVLIDLTLSVPSQKEAASICANWQRKSQEVYAYVMKELL